ncbi:hypothetical protein [Lignipirellula cremea]|uniref:Uncharacterized protein n=1 Tax=Lignipirellula cremea TaxID=2528010 RepID=A0A518DTL0_9BACT|nr:hypothetical protein [Lignipirellula cremea]QDU95175.1 hypothetical protein Pla8534_29870 [Lignipirellula cremea]
MFGTILRVEWFTTYATYRRQVFTMAQRMVAVAAEQRGASVDVESLANEASWQFYATLGDRQILGVRYAYGVLRRQCRRLVRDEQRRQRKERHSVECFMEGASRKECVLVAPPNALLREIQERLQYRQAQARMLSSYLRMIAYGATQRQAARIVGVSDRTARRWQADCRLALLSR